MTAVGGDAADTGCEPPAAGAGRPGVWMFLILLVALAVRLPFLGDGYGIDDDEFYSLRNSEELLATPTPPAVKAWPVTFTAARAMTELVGLSPLSLRWLPFVCGLLAPLMVFRIGRRFVSPRAALLAAALVALWPWHQYYSGLARYYSPLFLWALLILDRLDRVLTAPRRGDVAALILLLLLAAATHTTGVLAVGGGLVALGGVRRLSRRGLAVLVGGVVTLGGVIAAVPALSGPVRHVLSGAGGFGYGVVQFAMSLALNVTPLLGVLATLGAVALLAERRDGSRAFYLTAAAVAPAAALLGLAVVAGVDVQARYAMAGMPALVLLAGAGADRMLTPLLAPAAGPVVRAAAVGAVLVPFLPSALSNLIDGNRHDVPAAAEHLAAALDDEEHLFAEGHSLYVMTIWGLDRRLPPGVGEPPFPRALEESPPTAAQLDAIDARDRDARFVLPDNVFETLASRGEDAAGFGAWLRRRAVVERRIGERRLDYHRNVLTVYRSRRATDEGAGS